MNPDLFDMTHFKGCDEDQRDRAAAVICRGCPVMAECAADALVPLAVGTVRAGVWLPVDHDRRRRERVAQLRLTAAEVDRG